MIHIIKSWIWNKTLEFADVAGLNSRGHGQHDMSGYMSDGDLVRRHHGHAQNGQESTYGDTGYISDNHYDRRAQRMAYEEQRARAEQEHRKYLEMSGKIGPGQQSVANNKPTYKLMQGSRKHVKKSDSGKIVSSSAEAPD